MSVVNFINYGSSAIDYERLTLDRLISEVTDSGQRFLDWLNVEGSPRLTYNHQDSIVINEGSWDFRTISLRIRFDLISREYHTFNNFWQYSPRPPLSFIIATNYRYPINPYNQQAQMLDVIQELKRHLYTELLTHLNNIYFPDTDPIDQIQLFERERPRNHLTCQFYDEISTFTLADFNNIRDLYRVEINWAERIHGDWFFEDNLEATERAKTLLLENLTPIQQCDYEQNKYFYCTGSDGDLYKILERSQINVRKQVGGQWLRMCVVLADSVPTPDLMLAQKILIETDQQTFDNTAILHGYE